MTKTRKNVPISSAIYAASPRSCTLKPPVGQSRAGGATGRRQSSTRTPRDRRPACARPDQGRSRLDQIGQLTSHPRARNHEIETGRLGSPPGLDVDVGVEPEGTAARSPRRPRDRPARGRRRSASRAARIGTGLAADDDLVTGRSQRRLDPAGQHQVGDEREDRATSRSDRAAAAVLGADALRPAPHLQDLGAALVQVADDHLAGDPLAVEHLQHPGDRLRARPRARSRGRR